MDGCPVDNEHNGSSVPVVEQQHQQRQQQNLPPFTTTSKTSNDNKNDTIKKKKKSSSSSTKKDGSEVKSVIISPTLRYTTNALSLISVLLYSGIIFGWAPLELLLLREGQYSELCVNNNDAAEVAAGAAAEEDITSSSSSPCSEQMNQLNVIFTMAQFVLSFSSLPVGFFLDWAPQCIHVSIAAIIELIGLILFGLSDSQTYDRFVLGYCFMALGGCMAMLGSFPGSFLVRNYQACILACVSCLFDASSILFSIFNTLHEMNDVVFTRWNIGRRKGPPLQNFNGP